MKTKESVKSACEKVALNWRIRKRLPRITKKAKELGYIKK